MFTVNHPAWQSPPGTVIELPALTSEIAAKADRESEFAEAAREEVREFREHADLYDDEELMQLGAIALAGLGDQIRTFQNREAVIRYLALNASPRMEDLWVSDDSEWLEAPRRWIEFPDMLAWRKEQLLRHGPPSLREQELICYSEDEIRRFGLDAKTMVGSRRTGSRLQIGEKRTGRFGRERLTIYILLFLRIIESSTEHTPSHELSTSSGTDSSCCKPTTGTTAISSLPGRDCIRQPGLFRKKRLQVYAVVLGKRPTIEKPIAKTRALRTITANTTGARFSAHETPYCSGIAACRSPK